jgi:hypothetical protein
VSFLKCGTTELLHRWTMTMTAHLEKLLEDKAVTYALGLNYLHWKMNALGSKGKPDQLFQTPWGGYLWIEFKRMGEQPEPLQRYWAKQIVQRRGLVYGCDDFEHAKAIFHNHLDPAAVPIAGAATYDAAGLSWSIPRPWTGKNIHLPDGIQDSQRKRTR